MLVALLVLGYWLVRERVVPTGGAPAKGERLRVVTWNLRNFPDPQQDLARLRERLTALDADLLALQEIHDPAALQALLPGWDLRLSQRGGRGHQRLGIAFDPGVFELVAPAREHPELSQEGHVRPGLSAYLRARAGGFDFHVLVVHLKAKADGYGLRRRQWPALAELARDLLRRDPDLVVLGDFNATGPAGGAPADELAELERMLGPLGLRRVPPEEPCSAYWDGARRDAWQEPSLLDLVWVAGMADALGPADRARSLHHCARHACRAFRSTDAYPEPDFADLSDHCPVAVDLAQGGNEG